MNKYIFIIGYNLIHPHNLSLSLFDDEIQMIPIREYKPIKQRTMKDLKKAIKQFNDAETNAFKAQASGDNSIGDYIWDMDHELKTLIEAVKEQHKIVKYYKKRIEQDMDGTEPMYMSEHADINDAFIN